MSSGVISAPLAALSGEFAVALAVSAIALVMVGYATIAWSRAVAARKRALAALDRAPGPGAGIGQRIYCALALLPTTALMDDPAARTKVAELLEAARSPTLDDSGARNLRMAERIGATAVHHPFSFVIAGDSGAWPDPTADAIFAQLLAQTAELRPSPVFFANLGDFAGPGTPERHQRYLELVAPLSIPNVCLVGNHDLEDPRGPEAWTAVHGPANFHFAYGNTRFVAIDGATGQAGELGDTTPPDTAGPSVEALRFLEETLAATSEPHRVVLMHAPPHLDGHYAPQPECGFRQGEPEFLDIIRRHDVKLVCCAHGLGFDHHVRDGIRFVMTGGGGAAQYLSYRNAGSRERGALFHAVEITLDESGAASGRVFQAFAPPGSAAPFTFGG